MAAETVNSPSTGCLVQAYHLTWYDHLSRTVVRRSRVPIEDPLRKGELDTSPRHLADIAPINDMRAMQPKKSHLAWSRYASVTILHQMKQISLLRTLEENDEERQIMNLHRSGKWASETDSLLMPQQPGALCHPFSLPTHPLTSDSLRPLSHLIHLATAVPHNYAS